MPKFINIEGQRFGRLIAHHRDIGVLNRKPFWMCLCDCGKWKSVNGSDLRGGKIRSCGCLRREHLLSVRPPNKHMMRYSKEYKVWIGIKDRCNNPNYHHYHTYGGRGITVCERWLNSFENFYADMGPRPSPKHTIERKDNEKGYSPDNCKWELMHVQSRNKRTSRIIEYNGVKKNMVDWADDLGIPRGSMKTSLRRGETIEEIVSRRTNA